LALGGGYLGGLELELEVGEQIGGFMELLLEG
jgi:hypothetical protein